MSRSTQQVEKFSKFLSYVLGYRPDEFGIVPDDNGFVEIKELLKALHEEPGWRHIRAVHLFEVATVSERPTVEIDDSRIRALDRSKITVTASAVDLPKLLYIAIRRRAHAVVMDKGLTSQHRPHLVLALEKEMAMRIGRRLDNDPILLTVQVAASQENGTSFHQYGQHLFLADKIASGTFSTPPLPKDTHETKPAPSSVKPSQAKTPGSFFPEPDRFEPQKHHPPTGKKHKEPDWKKERRQARRNKQRQNN